MDGVALVRGNGQHYYCTDDTLPEGATERCEGNIHKLAEPCPFCGYKYGTAWLKKEVPQEVVDWLFSLPDTDIIPAWV